MINPEDYRHDWNLPHVDVWTTTEYPQLAQAYTNAQGHAPNDNWAAFQTYRRYMEPNIWTFEKMLEWETNGGAWNPNPNPTPPSKLSLLKSDDFLFLNDHGTWRHKGFTSFKLCNLFERGQDINSVLFEHAGYNAPRIFLYTPSKYWGSEAWNAPHRNAVVEFVRNINSKGFYAKIVLATDDDQSKVDYLKELVQHLNGFDLYLLWEAVNEPFIHEKLDPSIFKNVLSGSKYIYTSGIYTDNRLFWGQYWVDHSARDSEWYRKGGHNLYEANWAGGGPSFPEEPALYRACIEDEPIKPHEAGYDTKAYYEYAASCGLMGAGATFHSENGKFGRPLSLGELGCKDAFLKGLNVFPVDAVRNIPSYRRIVEPGNNPGEDNVSGRTYVVGNYSIRIHQKGTAHPENGWRNLDSYGVAFAR